MKILKNILWIKILLAVLIVVAVGLFAWHMKSWTTARDYQTRAARIKSVSSMIDLCTTDLHEEMPVKDCINGKWIVARQVIEGRIRFDLDSLKIEEKGDTTILYLPPERVEILESASPDAYEVLDAWDGRNKVFSRTLTAQEENVLKTRWQKRAVERIYDRGYVKDARRQAMATLAPLIREMKGPFDKQGPVLIVDPTPHGRRPQ